MAEAKVLRIEAIEGEPIFKNEKRFVTYVLYVMENGDTHRRMVTRPRKKEVVAYLSKLPEDRSKYNHCLEFRENGIVTESFNLFASL